MRSKNIGIIDVLLRAGARVDLAGKEGTPLSVGTDTFGMAESRKGLFMVILLQRSATLMQISKRRSSN